MHTIEKPAHTFNDETENWIPIDTDMCILYMGGGEGEKGIIRLFMSAFFL